MITGISGVLGAEPPNVLLLFSHKQNIRAHASLPLPPFGYEGANTLDLITYLFVYVAGVIFLAILEVAPLLTSQADGLHKRNQGKPDPT